MPQSADDCFRQYRDVLQSLADRFAPVTKITIRRQRLAAWMDAECRQLRRSLVCLKGVTVVQSNHLIDSSGLSTRERDIKCTGEKNSYTGLCSCLNMPVNRGSCDDH